jgi:hypothetical protein
MFLMPGCTGGSSGHASGCYFFGLNLNWFVQLGTVAFVGSFITVPIGLVVLLLGTIASWLGGGKGKENA